VLVLNPALARSLGIEKRQAEGSHFWELIRDAGLNDAIGSVLSTRRPVRMEHTILLSDATFEIRISPVFEGADFLGAVAVFHDVTRLKELEKSRSEFVANVSHELKTPLTSILGFIETLKEGAIDDADNRMKFLGIIQDHSMKLHRLIEDLLVLSRIESGSRAFEVRVVNLGALLDETLGLFAQALRAKGVSVERQFEAEPFLFKADPQAMEDVLSNLVDNAIKYNEAGGKITVKASRHDGAVRIEVRDTGIGIPEAELPRVFERFYRVDKSRSRESGGSGLGLSIVKHLVERHGGRVEALRLAPKGTAFVVTLPASAPASS
jgi:two-component system phosphate regulon sensor histidine kinase PhoR